MSYYAAGGYYQAGGFSFKKLVRAATKAVNFVQSQPILSGVVGLVPGGSTLLSGASAVAGMASLAGGRHAVTQGTLGTPGHNAFGAVRRLRRRRRRSYR